MRLPTYAEHRRFCEVDGWQDKDAKSRKKKGDHHRYTKPLPDGRVLYTRVSHGSGEYKNPDFWESIRREQLQVSASDFWAAVDAGVAPARTVAQPPPPEGEPIDLWLVKNLKEMVGLDEKVIGAMTPNQAQKAWDDWCATPTPGESA
jgi:hypothetical protein